MKTVLVLATMCTLLATGGCDPDTTEPEQLEEEAQDIWVRNLVIGDFELSLETVHTALNGTCTTRIWHTAVGNGEYAVGTLGVGIADPDGNEVVGGIGLIGDVHFGRENTPADCWGEDGEAELLVNGAGGNLSLKAPRSGDPITLALAAPSADTNETAELDTMIFAADAVYGGGAETLRLQETVVFENDGDSGRRSEVTVDLVVDIVIEE